jgi:hypothetical protein
VIARGERRVPAVHLARLAEHADQPPAGERAREARARALDAVAVQDAEQIDVVPRVRAEQRAELRLVGSCQSAELDGGPHAHSLSRARPRCHRARRVGELTRAFKLTDTFNSVLHSGAARRADAGFACSPQRHIGCLKPAHAARGKYATAHGLPSVPAPPRSRPLCARSGRRPMRRPAGLRPR